MSLIKTALLVTAFLAADISGLSASDEPAGAIAAKRRSEYELYALTHVGSAEAGKKLYAQPQVTKCAVCHRVGTEGGIVGPDLTFIGGKFDRTHLVESLLEPSRQIVEGYRATLIVTVDGRSLTGIVKEQSDDSLKLAASDGTLTTIAVRDIESRKTSDVSMMPEGLATQLTPEQFTDLIAYLETLRSGGKGSPGSGLAGPITVPPGFSLQVIATGLTGATAMESLPDGRLLICEQAGAVRVVEHGRLLEKPFITLPVENNWERGVIGVTIDPRFNVNHWVYVCWVAKEPYPHHVISRFTADGNVAIPGSELVLLEGDDQRKLGGKVPAGHQGGALHFGKDGDLYIGIGEQTAELPAQNLDTLQGKILRIHPDGSIPADNPFVKETTGKYQAIWARGCRNPFTFAIDRTTGEILINDVGGKFEEINRGVAGANYGWPVVDHGPTTRSDITGPIHIYPQASIAGGDFSGENPAWPAELRHKYFFADFVHGWIKALDPASPENATEFVTGLRRPVDLRFAADGSLDVLLRNAWVVDDKFVSGTSSLIRIAPNRVSTAPVAAISVTEETVFGDMDCFRIETPTATYVYGKKGAGFASIIDREGHDWIAYRPGGRAAGEFRGLPKCGQPTKYFHCGYGYGQYRTDNVFKSEITLREPGHVRIHSETANNDSACDWDFFPDHATLTLLRIGHPQYWFLYEGAPGGKLDPEDDFIVRPGNRRTPLSEPWKDKVPWVYFGAKESPSSALFLINHQPPVIDSYVAWPYQRDAAGSFQEMTVFGFGRPDWQDPKQHTPPLTGLPARFSIGMAGTQNGAAVEALIGRVQKSVSETGTP